MLPGMSGACGRIMGAGASGGTTLQFVGGTTGSGNGTGTLTVSLTGLTGGLASAPAAGDIVVVAHCVGGNSDLNLTMNTAGFTEVADLYANDSRDTSFAVYHKIMGGSPDTSVNVSKGGVGQSTTVAVSVWRGINPTTPEDVAATTATGVNSGQPNPPSITPMTPGALIVVCGGAANGNAAAFTVGDLTKLMTIGHNASAAESACGTAVYEAWISGAFDPASWGGSEVASDCSWAAITLALRPA